MRLDTAFDLCDAIAAAIRAAHTTWDVSTLVDVQIDSSKLTADGVEFALFPVSNEEVVEKDSRHVIGTEVLVAMRLRTRIASRASSAEVREKCGLWDEACAVIQRAEGFDLGERGHFRWNAGTVALNVEALRKDRCVFISAIDTSFMAVRRNPKWSS